MLPKNNRQLIFFILAFFLVPMAVLSGCDRFKDKKVKPMQVAPKESPEELLQQGKVMFDKKRYEEAIEKFDAIKNFYPYHPLVTQAELQTGESYYAWKQYSQATTSFESFRRLHPLHEQADYAMLRQGESLFAEAPKTIDRDLTDCRKTVDLFNEFFQRYPLSSHLDKTHDLVFQCRTRMAGQEFYVGRFYYRTDKYQASIRRLEGVLQEHSGFGYDDKAAWYLGRAYLKVKATEDARRVFAHLAERYPDTPYGKKAKAKMSKMKDKDEKVEKNS